MTAQEYQQFQQEKQEKNREFFEMLKNSLTQETPSFRAGKFVYQYEWNSEGRICYIQVIRNSVLLLKLQYRKPIKGVDALYTLTYEFCNEPVSEWDLFKIFYGFIRRFHLKKEPLEIVEMEFSNHWGYQSFLRGQYDIYPYSCANRFPRRRKWIAKLEINNFSFSFPIS